jgi:hypothetical protein
VPAVTSWEKQQTVCEAGWVKAGGRAWGVEKRAKTGPRRHVGAGRERGACQGDEGQPGRGGHMRCEWSLGKFLASHLRGRQKITAVSVSMSNKERDKCGEMCQVTP